MCLCCLFTVLMLTLGLSSLTGRWMFLLWIGLLFLAFSGSFSLMPTATARAFGQRHYAMNYGLLFTSQVTHSYTPNQWSQCQRSHSEIVFFFFLFFFWCAQPLCVYARIRMIMYAC